MWKPGFVLSLAMLGVACVPKQPQVNVAAAPFDAKEVAFIHQDGTNAVRGQAFLRQRGGGIVTCAGREVWLVPEGRHARDRIRAIYGTTQRIARNVTDLGPADPEYRSHTRSTVCDAQGNFAFERLADGRYFVVSTVMWEVGGARQGGTVMAPVVLGNGEDKRLIIAP